MAGKKAKKKETKKKKAPAGKKVGSVLVVGGGIAGMQSSLDLADSGFKVYLLEKLPSIGGKMSQLDKTFPTNDCAMCIMAPKLVATGRHNNIELITNAEIDKVEGEQGNFRVSIRRKPRYINEEKCTGCGLCAQYCPIEAVDDYNKGLSDRKSIYVRYPQAVPLVFTIDKEKCIGCGLCDEMCEANAIEYDQQERIDELEAGSIVLAPGFEEFNPEVKKQYGYGRYANVLTSTEFERILSASGPFRGKVIRPSDGEIPKKIAFIQCVGSRDNERNYCSAVCCMYSTKEAIIAKEHQEGLNCHIFFIDMRAYGKGFDEYYERAKNEYGVKYTRCRASDVQEDPGTKNLLLRYEDETGKAKEEEFDLVVLSIGFQPPGTAQDLSKKLGIELNEHGFCETSKFSPLETTEPGIYVCGPFSEPKDIPETVAQASGAAAKASSPLSSERNTLTISKEYPPEKEVEGEPRIGVFICNCGTNIGGVVNVPEAVEYARTLPNVVHTEHNLYTCSQDTQEKIREVIEKEKLNRVIVASCTPRTHEPLFRETLQDSGLNPYLFEMANIREQCSWVHMHEHEKATKKAKDLVRMAVARSRLLEPLQKPILDVIKRGMVIGGGLAGMTAALELAEQGFETYLIEKEKELGGNLRNMHYSLEGEDPKEKLDSLIKEIENNKLIKVYTNAGIENIEGFVGSFKTTLKHDKKEEELEHGIIIVATGAKESTPEEYLYGKDKRVLTQLELEKKLSKGKLDAKTIVMIQCVGSRDDKRPYCSRVCCTDAVKNALKIKEQNPDAKVYVLYRDIRTYGFREEHYMKAREQGVVFLRYEKDQKPVVKDDKGLLKVELTTDIGGLLIEPDLIVLSAAIEPRENSGLSQILKIPLDENGFFLEAHRKLRPIDFATEGIFLSGLAHSPRFTEETISQASGAAARACTILSKDRLELEAALSFVVDKNCDGCAYCIEPCPYDAITLLEYMRDGAIKKTVEVNEAKCKGCGSCMATCPKAGIYVRHFKPEMIKAMVDAALEG